MLTNRFGIDVFYQAFKQAAGTYEYLDNKKFFYAIILIAQNFYKKSQAPIQQLFSEMLVDNNQNEDTGFTPILKTMDINNPDSHSVLSEESVITLIKHYKQLKNVFTSFYQDNFNQGGNFVTPWKVIQAQNRAMYVRCFLKFCRIFHLIPHVFNIEALQEFLFTTIPPKTSEQLKFYQECVIIKEYERDITYTTSKCQGHDQEPLIHFHEFLFLLAKIALNCVETTQNTISSKLQCFLKQNLSVKRPESPDMIGFHSSQQQQYNIDDEQDQDQDQDFNYHRGIQDGYGSDSQIQMMKRAQEAFKIEEQLNYQDILRDLDRNLPQIYQETKTQKVNPPPYAMPRIQINVPKKPLTEQEKKALKAKKAKPKPKPKPRKKDQPPPKPILWAGVPQLPPPSKILYPPPAPDDIATLIQSALVYQNDANYQLSLSTFVDARQSWKANYNLKDLRPEIQLFFDLSIASVYESWGKDGHALAQYMRARVIQLPYNHPDKAFPYCGLGGVLYHMQETDLSLRCYIQARDIREQRLGGDTVDTATIYNNLGCCMLLIERNIEASAFFELAQAILECELGASHERTLTVNRNRLKVKRTVQGREPEFKPLFHFAVPYQAVKAKKKKKGKKGKKKR